MNCDPMCRDSEQDTPLHNAAWNGHIDVVKFHTLKMHCDPTSIEMLTITPLNHSSSKLKEHLDVIQFFMSAPAWSNSSLMSRVGVCLCAKLHFIDIMGCVLWRSTACFIYNVNDEVQRIFFQIAIEL